MHFQVLKAQWVQCAVEEHRYQVTYELNVHEFELGKMVQYVPCMKCPYLTVDTIKGPTTEAAAGAVRISIFVPVRCVQYVRRSDDV